MVCHLQTYLKNKYFSINKKKKRGVGTIDYVACCCHYIAEEAIAKYKKKDTYKTLHPPTPSSVPSPANIRDSLLSCHKNSSYGAALPLPLFVGTTKHHCFIFIKILNIIL